ncbi:MAG: PaaI family thioesterase [Dehalococcoidia bacterium]|nr:PaaI family thioesterase [Dehalococcoidia bacterium]
MTETVAQKERLIEWMGAQLTEKGDGKAVATLPAEPHVLHADDNPRVAGGVVMALMDFCIHHAVHSLLAPNELHATIEMKLNFIRPGLPGVLIAEANVVNKGSRFAIVEGTITQQETGKLVAQTLTTETWVVMQPSGK